MSDLVFYILFSLLFLLFWNSLSKRSFESITLFLYHTIWGGFFLYYSLSNPSDIRYLFTGNNLENCQLALTVPLDNSNVVFCFAYFLKNYFINSFGLLCSIFNFVGFLGINTFFALSRKLQLKNKLDRQLITIFFFLPTVSFWSSINYKDCLIILFYAIILEFLYCFFINKVEKYQFLKVIIASISALLVRPYSIFFVLITLSLIGLISVINQFKKKELNFVSLLTFSLILILFIPAYKITTNQFSMTINAKTEKPILFPGEKVSETKSLKKFNLELIKSRIELSKTQSIGSKSYSTEFGLKKLLISLFGPFSFENNNYLVESLSGITFLFIFVRLLYFIIIKKIILIRPDLIFSLIMFSLELSKIQFILFNEGTIVRHRLVIYLFFSFLFIFHSKFNEKSAKSSY